MTALSSIVNCFTGPRCLRAALREKTAPVQRLLESLDGPTELRVSIPASVFGGDIFGVMSRQLREALVCPPPPASFARAARRRHLLQSIEPSAPEKSGFKASVFQNPLNVFPLFDSRLGQSTSSESTFASLEPTPAVRRLADSSPERVMARASGTTDLTDVRKKTEIRQQPQVQQETRTFPEKSALVSSLQRYWELIPERREGHSQPQPLEAEVPTRGAGFPVSEPEQRTAPRSWPNVTGNDLAEKLRAFSSGPSPSLKPARVNTTPDHQIQNIFNIEIKNRNQHAPDYDDLGERIANILHEQALQHGIDVT